VGICRWADSSYRRCRGGRCSARPGGSEWGSAGGQMASVVGAEVVALKKFSSPTGSPPPSALRASGSLALIACPRPSSGDVGEGIVAAASALRPSSLQFGHLERRSLSLLLERAAVSHLEPCRPAGPPMWGVVRTRGGGTGVPFVMAP
jgi:hypothetical protein